MTISKAETMRLVASGRGHECFTHETTGTYDVTLMRSAAFAGLYGPTLHADLTHETLEVIKKARDWDKDRVLSMTAEQMDEPSLWVHMPNDEHLLIDGTHRLLARATAGLTDFYLFMAPWSKIIRPNRNVMWSNPKHQWGKIDIGTDGKLYDRATGQPWKTGLTPNID